jgi:hypothetical protein
MIINYFDVFCESIRPTKADSPLIVDANTVLTGTITLESLKVIAGWNSQILKAISDFELSEFSPGNLGNIHKFFYTLALRERLSVFTFK